MIGVCGQRERERERGGCAGAARIASCVFANKLFLNLITDQKLRSCLAFICLFISSLGACGGVHLVRPNGHDFDLWTNTCRSACYVPRGDVLFCIGSNVFCFACCIFFRLVADCRGLVGLVGIGVGVGILVGIF